MVAEDNLSRTGLVDKKGNIVPDSHFIFTALPNADFMAESACHLTLASLHFLLHWQTESENFVFLLIISNDRARSS